MKILRAIGSSLQIVGELVTSLWHMKRWWATPLIIVLIFFALLFVLAASTGLGPFIYTLF